MSAKGRRKGGPLLLGMISARLANTTILENVLDGKRMSRTIGEVVERFGKGISLDSPVHLPSIASRVPSHILIMGNLSTTGVLLTGTSQEVRQATWQLMDAMKEFPNYRVASGCDLSPETPVENILAMMEAIKEYEG